MTVRIVCHSEDCPALCKSVGTLHGEMGLHKAHPCTCSGAGMVAVNADDLRELKRLWELHQAAPWPFGAETEPLINVVSDPTQPRDTISLVQVKDGERVEVGRIENVRTEPEEPDEKYELSRGD